MCVCLCYRKSRRTIDTTETVKKFGPLEVHYGKVGEAVIYIAAVETQPLTIADHLLLV